MSKKTTKDELGYALRSAMMGHRSIHDKIGPEEAEKRWEAEIGERTSSDEGVYKWSWYCGRQGDLDGLFVATRAEVDDAIGDYVYFGEVFGKHSEVSGTLETKEFIRLTDDPTVVEFVKEHGPFGFNPLDYIRLDCSDCGENINDYPDMKSLWCSDCEECICGSCVKVNHDQCESVVAYTKQDKRGA
jgi:hypothetical protein